jgi:hypothetical protein
MRRFVLLSSSRVASPPLFLVTITSSRLAATQRFLSAEGLERAGAARAQINALWAEHGNDPVSPLSAVHNEHSQLPASPSEVDARIAQCAAAARALMDQFKLTPQVPIEEDVTSALGDAFERLLLLLVPLESESVPYVERALMMAARSRYELSIRAVQHLFARTRTYAEALTLFHLLRQCQVKMTMHSYYAMIFCLQRLEEESWALKFREETIRRGKQNNNEKAAEGKDRGLVEPGDVSAPSVQGLEFILRGCDNQLLPESKPWLGRVAFSDAEGAYSFDATTKSADSFDALGRDWAQRFKNTSPAAEAKK